MDEEELLIKRYAYDTFSTPRNLIEIDFIFFPNRSIFLIA
jgi:hypothetical protein